MTKVVIESGDDIYQATEQALSRLDLSLENNSRVMIKPNLTKNEPPESGITTDVRAAWALVEYIESNNITIGEGSGGSSTDIAFQDQGYSEFAREKDLDLVNFDKGEIVEKEVEDSLTTEKIPRVKSVIESDFVISLAKLKTHSKAGVTLSMKNMFGAVPKRSNKLRYHFRIDRAILDFIQLLKPDLSLIEAFPGNQRDEIISDPVDSNIVIMSQNPLAADIVGC